MQRNIARDFWIKKILMRQQKRKTREKQENIRVRFARWNPLAVAFLTRLNSLSSLGIFHEVFFSSFAAFDSWEAVASCVCALAVCFAFCYEASTRRKKENKNDKTKNIMKKLAFIIKQQIFKVLWLLKNFSFSCFYQIF